MFDYELANDWCSNLVKAAGNFPAKMLDCRYGAIY